MANKKTKALDIDNPPEEAITAACVPPTGSSFVPSAGTTGSMLVSDGINWANLPPPTNGTGHVLTWGTNGPFWQAQ